MIPKKPDNVTWTLEQWQAIYEDNKNVIVSAGAGSGKTAVLTERVIRKLKDGVHINQLLILTFTKAAAMEMADRIRKKIKKIPELSAELSLLDSAYITTFDSFALSIVKRYHYLVNLNSDIDIIDNGVISIEKNNIMDELFLELYKDKNPMFLNMIKSFCVKDDKDIKNYILSISNKLDLLSNKEEYLKTYIDIWFDDNKIKRDICEYFELIKTKIENIKLLVKEITYIDNEFSVKLDESLNILYEASSYDDVVTRLNIKLPMAPRGSDDRLKELKSGISDIIKDIKGLCIYNSDEIRDNIISTRDTVSVIIDIILEFTKRVNLYKYNNNSYEFNDIAVMAINIVKNNKDIREELFNSFNEIMIDEYQDTNDLQEEFISMISNHNVYMVGDIKQSIYRFRNANPYIFKDKYDSYTTSNIDEKIDLNKNFRSRNEVLDNINVIFDLVMSDNIGGADYIKSHQMIFGNKNYLDNKVDNANDMEVYTYNYDKELKYSREEIEAFTIATDIKNRCNNKYQVIDKDTNILRDVTYNDFAIIMDRASDFDLYKKIFSYMGIPITLFKDEKMNDTDDLNVIRNLIRIIIKIKNRKLDVEFKHLFISIMRSFLYDVDDNIIFNYFINNSFKDSDLYIKCLEISKKIDYITIHELLDIIVLEFDYYNKLISIGNINNNIIKLDKIYDMAYNLESLGYDIEKFSSYLVELTSGNYTLEYKINDNNSNSVKIMTIHKSKGLEYPVCYFSGLYKKFNISDLKEKFIYDKTYGIIVPYFNTGIGETIYKDLLKNKYLTDEISEKIRLFYVALTRAREKIIIVKPNSDKVNDNCNLSVLDDNLKNSYRSLDDILNSVYFRIHNKYIGIDIDNINLSNDYKLIKLGNYKDSINRNNIKLEVCEINIDNNDISSKHFSKVNNNLITKSEYDNMKMGTMLHEILELIDLKNPNYNLVDNDYYKDIIRNFLSSDIMSNVKDATIYKEYEFIYEDNDTKYHGIIDLMLEYDNYIDIIDYKLKNVIDDNYKKQLYGYRDYISTKSKKKINLYLYSLIDMKLYKI